MSDDHTIRPRERETIDELLSLSAQFALLAGFIDGLTAGCDKPEFQVRKGGLADLRKLLHGMAHYKARLAGRLKGSAP